MLLEVVDLCVRYGRLTAVDHLNLAIDEGKTLALVGPNGAGKTSTLRAIMGLLRPHSGAIRYDGSAIIGSTPEVIVRRGLALVPEGRQIFGTLTVKENLQIPVVSNGARRDRTRLEAILEAFPVLKRYEHTPAGRLSGGEQQQLAVARALILEPRLLLLDEPSLGLAPQMIDVVFDILEGLRRGGTTILLVEQNVERAVAFADDTIVLRSGAVVLSGSSGSLTTDAIEEAYFGS